MMAQLLLMCVAAAIVAAAAPVLAHGLLRRRAFAYDATRLKALARAPGRASAKISEAGRLRFAGALLDLGNHLMLSAEERKAFRLRKRLSSARARRLGVAVAAAKAGARSLDDVTLEIPIGERAQEGNPKRTLALSCVVYESPEHEATARSGPARRYPMSSRTGSVGSGSWSLPTPRQERTAINSGLTSPYAVRRTGVPRGTRHPRVLPSPWTSTRLWPRRYVAAKGICG